MPAVGFKKKNKKNSITKMGMEMRGLFSNRHTEINKKEIAALGFFSWSVFVQSHMNIFTVICMFYLN